MSERLTSTEVAHIRQRHLGCSPDFGCTTQRLLTELEALRAEAAAAVEAAYREGWEDALHCEGPFSDCRHFGGALTDHHNESTAMAAARRLRGETDAR